MAMFASQASDNSFATTINASAAKATVENNDVAITASIRAAIRAWLEEKSVRDLDRLALSQLVRASDDLLFRRYNEGAGEEDVNFDEAFIEKFYDTISGKSRSQGKDKKYKNKNKTKHKRAIMEIDARLHRLGFIPQYLRGEVLLPRHKKSKAKTRADAAAINTEEIRHRDLRIHFSFINSFVRLGSVSYIPDTEFVQGSMSLLIAITSGIPSIIG